VVYPQHNVARFRVLQPDGKPLTERHLGFEWNEATHDSGSGSGMPLDENGAGAKAFVSPGLWHVSFRYRDSPVHWIPVRESPYYEAAAVVAVSPLLEKRPPTPLTAQHHEPGALIVQLQDVNGRPARGPS
jgi:hypothetical protein